MQAFRIPTTYFCIIILKQKLYEQQQNPSEH